MNPKALLEKTREILTQTLNDLLDDDVYVVPLKELNQISEDVGIHVSTLIKMCKDLGFEVEKPTPEKVVRGFRSNPNNRWQSCPSHGGSGAEIISGFAGREG